MDCYPRFQKSKIIKDCLVAEMEGQPLPVQLPATGSEDKSAADGAKRPKVTIFILGSPYIIVSL